MPSCTTICEQSLQLILWWRGSRVADKQQAKGQTAPGTCGAPHESRSQPRSGQSRSDIQREPPRSAAVQWPLGFPAAFQVEPVRGADRRLRVSDLRRYRSRAHPPALPHGQPRSMRPRMQRNLAAPSVISTSKIPSLGSRSARGAWGETQAARSRWVQRRQCLRNRLRQHYHGGLRAS